MANNIVVTGANGWIGGHVGDALTRDGWSVTGVSRTPVSARERRPGWVWVGVGTDLDDAVEGADVVLNLAGRHPFEQTWTPEYSAAMYDSRIDTTRRVVTALARSGGAERVLVSGSGYPVYGNVGEEMVTENHATSGELVAGAMDRDWEDAARPVEQHGVRLVLLRLGLVLGADGGAFPILRQPFDEGAGVVLGDGRQWMPWVHIADCVRLICAIVADQRYRGAVNVVSPQPARHADLADALAHGLGVPCETVLPTDQVTAMLGGASELLLASQRMVPGQATSNGFSFVYPEIGQAVKDLLAG